MKSGMRIACVAAFFPLIGAAPADLPQPLTVGVEGLRSARGLLQICLTRLPDHFPDCTGDPDKRHFSISVAQADNMPLGDLPPGGYALAIIHDQNSNRKLDTFMGIPKEGIGFSENPSFHFGPPSFKAARFTIAGGAVRQDVKMRYFL